MTVASNLLKHHPSKRHPNSMKCDMQEVLLHRGRVAHEGSRLSTREISRQKNAYRRAKKFVIDENGDVCDEFSRSTLAMRSRNLGYNIKTEMYNSSFLNRFLRSQVGRPWNSIYSEIRTALKSKTRKQSDIIFTIKWDIPVHTYLKDGRVWSCDFHFGPCDRKGELYVDPKTKNLCIGHH